MNTSATIPSSSELINNCQWMMMTSIFHKFGSQVIEKTQLQINRQPIPSPSNTLRPHSMVIVPIDSKRYIYQG